jgi:hypothetical protein
MTDLYDTPKVGVNKDCCMQDDTDLKVSKERVHEKVKHYEGCKYGIQNSHEDKPSFKPEGNPLSDG